MSKKLLTLMIAIVVAMAVLTGCAFAGQGVSETEPIDVSLSNESVGSVTQLKDVSANTEFGITSSVLPSALAQYVSVVDSVGNAVAVSFVAGAAEGSYRVVAPEGGYADGGAYRISLKEGVAFEGAYAESSVIDFIVAKEEVYDVQLQDNVVVLDANACRIQANGNVFSTQQVDAGNYVIVPVEGEAYHAYFVEGVSFNGAGFVLEVSDPQDLADVFGDIDIYERFKLSEGSISVNEDNLAAQIADIEASFAIGDYLPEFSLDRKEFSSEKAYIDFTLSYTVKGIVFSIKVCNDIDIVPEVNYSTIPFSLYAGADMVVATTTTFAISTGYSMSGSEDMEEFIMGIEQLQDKEFTATLAKLFKWEVAYGPLSLAYDLDLVFSISISGDLSFVTTTTNAYSLGAYYVDGEFSSFAERDKISGLQLERVDLYGKLGASIGLRNTLTLKLVQVASVGIQLELGFYLDLYGAVSINVADIKGTVAGIYGDFGFYYTVDLIAALGIADFKLDKTFNLAGDKLSIFTFGDRYMILDYTDDITSFEVKSAQSVLPALAVKQYDLVSRQVAIVELDIEDSIIYCNSTDNYFTIEDGIITLTANAPAEFGEATDDTQYVTYQLVENEKINHVIAVTRSRDLPYAEDAIGAFSKNNVKAVNFVINLLDAEFVSVKGLPTDAYTFNNVNGQDILSVKKEYLIVKENGTLSFGVQTSKNIIDLWIEVSGTLQLKSFGAGTANSPYRIYSADQLFEMSAKANLYNYYTGEYFVLMNSISLGNMDYTPIYRFNGVLDGNGYTVSSFKLYGNGDGNVGFIATNTGTISNLKLTGVTATRNQKNLTIGALVGCNMGTIQNCSATGSITASYETGASSEANLKVGGLVGYNDATGTIKSSVSRVSLSVTTTGCNVTGSKSYVAGVAAYNKGTLSGCSYYSTMSVSVKDWHDKYTATLANDVA